MRPTLLKQVTLMESLSHWLCNPGKIARTEVTDLTEVESAFIKSQLQIATGESTKVGFAKRSEYCKGLIIIKAKAMHCNMYSMLLMKAMYFMSYYHYQSPEVVTKFKKKVVKLMKRCAGDSCNRQQLYKVLKKIRMKTCHLWFSVIKRTVCFSNNDGNTLERTYHLTELIF